MSEDLVIDHLDFEPACELRRDQNPAKWCVVTNDCPGCGDSKRLLCDGCKGYAELLNGAAVHCPACKTVRILCISRIESLHD